MKNFAAFIISSSAVVAVLVQTTAIGGDPGKGILYSKDVQAFIEPAVSSINGKIDTHYGEVNDEDTRGVGASISLPLGERYGFQFDTLYEHALDNDIYGAGGHLFTRRPDVGLLGVAAGMTDSDDYSDALVGVEGEYYLDKVTLGGFVGYNNFDTHIIPVFNPAVANETDYLAARLYAAVYPMDDLMVRLEYQHRFDLNFFIANVEYQTPIRGLALFVDGGVGENDYSHLIGGARIYFGDNKTLKDRHRKDDPSNILSDFINTGITGGSNNSPAPSGGEEVEPPPFEEN
jgi:hypothetical protein